MNAAKSLAVVGVTCCRRQFGNSIGHVVFEQYLQALAGTALVPLAIPARGAQLGGTRWQDAIVSRLDGLILPGSPSNVAPARYGGPPEPEMQLDEDRDATTLPLMRLFARAWRSAGAFRN